MTSAAINATALKAFIARIERLEAEKAAIAADIKAIYDEAKATGYSAKIMRQVVRRRAQDPDKLAQQEAELEMYADAVGFGSLPLGKIIAAVKSAGPRVADVKAKLAEGESVDPETGEVIIIDQQDDNIHLRVTVDERVAKVLSDAPRPSNRDVSTDGKPYPEAGPQAEASHAGTGSGMPAVHEGHISEGAAYTDEAVTVERHVNAAPPISTPVAQRSEPIAHNDLVAGSNPAGRTNDMDRRPKARAAEMA